jgi:hypothetical protein
VAGLAELAIERVCTGTSGAPADRPAFGSGGAAHAGWRIKAIEFEFSVEAEEIPSEFRPWMLRRKMARSEIDVTESELAPTVRHPDRRCRSREHRSIGRDAGQPMPSAYGRWHSVVSCDDSAAAQRLLARLASEFPELTAQVCVTDKFKIGGFGEVIARGNAGKQLDSIGVVSAGDVLDCDALLQMAVFRARRRLRECSSHRIRNAARERADKGRGSNDTAGWARRLRRSISPEPISGFRDPPFPINENTATRPTAWTYQ